ncbi:MAG: cbb3-type cytochrome oxidase assembly protein CcoS [Bacteroidota bacterium]|nr:cbb3-type cytochrome oxidase assembly protein CcoS [Bacteroidota bacterium]
MSVVIVLVFVAIIMAGIFLLAFIWSVKNGQYEDTYTPSVRILFDDPVMKEEEKTKAPSPTLPQKGREHITANFENSDIIEE